MLTLTREQKNGQTLIRLSGAIDENVDFNKTFGDLPQNVEIVCRDITYINSPGVRAWMIFFNRAASSGVQFTFSECPPPLVEQLNYISNFGCGGTVSSVSVPFACAPCRTEIRGTIKSLDLKQVAYRVPSVKCPKCGSSAKFEEVPEEYFGFLIRQNA
jgi:anti-anti-sigma regulatory factor